METFLAITFIFMIGCILGWFIELFYRRWASGHWVNPGFLKGPYLPLYGFGLTILFLIAMIPLHDWISQDWLVLLIQAILVCVMMTFIEFIAGLIFIRGMKIELWDYSNMWGNVMGIICPLFSFFWTVLGAAYVVFLHPLIYDAVVWFTNNIIYSYFVGVFSGLMIFDFITSMNVALKIREFAEKHQIVVKYEKLKEHLLEKRSEWKGKRHFLNPFAEFRKVSENNEVSESFLSKRKNKRNKDKE